MIAALAKLFTRRIDWSAKLEADRALREQLIGRAFAKRRAAQRRAA